MNLRIEAFTGQAAKAFKPSLAKLRLEVFREYPYLYAGTMEEEESYLDTFMKASKSILVVAFDQEKVIGVSTGIPMAEQAEEVQKPWVEAGDDVNQIFYFSESVLQKAYRGQGIGLRFFEARESHARTLNYSVAAFCGVIREENHPHRPKDYTPLDQFWTNRGYTLKEGYICTMPWKEPGDLEERTHSLQFWSKSL